MVNTKSKPHGAGIEPDRDERIAAQACEIASLREQVAALAAARDDETACRAQLALELDDLRESNAEWEWVFENSLDIVCNVGMDGRLQNVNKAMVDLLGVSKETLLSKQFSGYVHPEDFEHAMEQFAKLRAGCENITIEARCLDRNGDWRWISWTTPGFSLHRKNLHAIGRDTTQTKATQSELLFRLQHDPLTKLSNRLVFEQSLHGAISRAERNPTIHVALLMIDLNGFKSVNDTLGHAAGDVVLKAIAQRYGEHQRKTDVVCRLGGDEFAWIVEGPMPLVLDALVLKIREITCIPIAIGERLVQVGCSIGIARFPGAAVDAASLSAEADAAMYDEKRRMQRTR